MIRLAIVPRGILAAASGALLSLAVANSAAATSASAAGTSEPADSAAAAEAGKGLRIIRAEIDGGRLVVTGISPRPRQLVTIDRKVRARSSPGRVFTFSSLYHPATCVIDVRAGAVSKKAVVRFCGLRGEAGEPGPDGRRGPRGPRGEPGEQGLAGLAGPRGAAGPIGDAGPAGDQGLAGDPGPVGISGPDGPRGAAGPAGPTGTQGPGGAIGLVGPTGNQGPAGAIGPAGAQGIPGTTGPRGPAGGGPTLVRSFGPAIVPVPTLFLAGVGTCDIPLQSSGGTYRVIARVLVEVPSAPSDFLIEAALWDGSSASDSYVTFDRVQIQANAPGFHTLTFDAVITVQPATIHRVGVLNWSSDVSLTVRNDLMPCSISAIDLTPAS